MIGELQGVIEQLCVVKLRLHVYPYCRSIAASRAREAIYVAH